MSATVRLIVSSLAVLAMLGCRNTAPDGYRDFTVDTTQARAAASLGVGDVFEVRVHAHDDLSGDYRIGPEGTIDFPLVGRLSVAGLNGSAIADLVRSRLADGYLRSPSVTVYVKQFNSKKVFVLGQVAKPGMYDFSGTMSIVQAIAMAGGFTGLASSNYAIVRRVVDGVERRIPIPVQNIMTQGAEDFDLEPGDVVYVPETVL